MSIRKALIAAFAVSLVMPILIFSATAVYAADQYTKKNLEKTISDTSFYIKNAMTATLNSFRGIAEAILINDQYFTSDDSSSFEHPEVLGFFTLENAEISSPRSSYKSGSFIIDKSRNDTKTARILYIAEKNKSLYAVEFSFTNFAGIATKISSIEESNSIVIFCDIDGYFASGELFCGNIINDSQTSQYSILKDSIEKKPSEPLVFRYKLGSFSNISGTHFDLDSGFTTTISIPSTHFDEFVGDARSSVLICAFLMIFFMSVLGLFIIFIITKPIYIIMETMENVYRGKTSERISYNFLNNFFEKTEYGDIRIEFNNYTMQLVAGKDRYMTIFEMTDDIIFEWSFLDNIVRFSNNYLKKFNYRSPDDTFENSFLQKADVHQNDRARYYSDIDNLAVGGEIKYSEYRIKNIYGDYVWFLLRTRTIKDRDHSRPIKIIGVLVDIDRRKKSAELMQSRASFDALTKIYNRETIESLINNEIDLIDKRREQVAVLFIDVDNFKYYNDHFSHATGDDVLRFIAAAINHIIEHFGFLGRYGGDEFVACIRNIDTNQPAQVAQKILSDLKQGFMSQEGVLLSVSVSIGIALVKDSSKRVDQIIADSDDAMYKVKKSGKGNFAFI